LFDLKYDPSILEIPVPRYFKEDDRINVEIEFKEKVERGDGGKKKKKKKKKSKKKAAGDDDEKDKGPPPPTLQEKQFLLNKLLEERYGMTDPEEEIVHDPFTLDMEIVSAIRLIQKNERGRQYRQRLLEILHITLQRFKQEELKRKLREGVQQETRPDMKDFSNAIII
jgi:hypothetical protein